MPSQCMKGKKSGARQIKIDFTTAEKTAEKIEEGIRRRRNYVHHLRIRRGKKKRGQKNMKDGFRWPKQADGSEPTRQQVLEEARKLTENNGIQLMHDGITFKIRVPSGKEEEEGWRQIFVQTSTSKCQFRG